MKIECFIQNTSRLPGNGFYLGGALRVTTKTARTRGHSPPVLAGVLADSQLKLCECEISGTISIPSRLLAQDEKSGWESLRNTFILP